MWEYAYVFMSSIEHNRCDLLAINIWVAPVSPVSTVFVDILINSHGGMCVWVGPFAQSPAKCDFFLIQHVGIPKKGVFDGR